MFKPSILYFLGYEYCRDLDYMQFDSEQNYDYNLVASSNQDLASNAMHQSGGFWSSSLQDASDNKVDFKVTLVQGAEPGFEGGIDDIKFNIQGADSIIMEYTFKELPNAPFRV